jgi:hypothetical protein
MPTNRFQFGEQTIKTRVNVMVPRQPGRPPLVDVTAAMDDRSKLRAQRRLPMAASAPIATEADPFAEVEI